MSLFRVVLAFHIACGLAVVLAGAVALLARKPVDDPRASAHRRAGRVFRIAHSAVIGSAMLMTILHFTPYLLGLTTGALIGLFSGVRVLRRRRPDLDPRQRATALDWIVTLAAIAIGLWLVFESDPRGPSAVVQSTAFSVLAYGFYDVYRFLRPQGFPFSPRLWLYEHLFKTTCTYFGAVAAFSGNLLPFIPSPWRELWAVAFGQTLAVGLVVHYVRRHRPDAHTHVQAEAA